MKKEAAALTGADFRDLHFGEGLAMVLTAQVVLAPAEFHDRDLLALAVTHDRGDDLAAREEGRAQLDVGALTQEQHLAELDGGARLGVQFFDAQRGVFRDPVLLTTGGDDRVHEKIPEETRRPDERPRILLTGPRTVKPPFPIPNADLGRLPAPAPMPFCKPLTSARMRNPQSTRPA